MMHLLDRPIWSALGTRHASLAEGGTLARRYPASIARFAATESEDKESLQALAELASTGEALLLLMADPIVAPSDFVTTTAASAVQMIGDRRLQHGKRDADPTSSAASCVGMMRGDEHRSI